MIECGGILIIILDMVDRKEYNGLDKNEWDEMFYGDRVGWTSTKNSVIPHATVSAASLGGQGVYLSE
jgi:hypothetical protein